MRINRRQLDKVLLSTPDLNTTARMILLAYASHMSYAEDAQEAWPSEEVVCNYAGVGIDTLRKYKEALIEDGFLIMTRRERQRGTNRLVRYYSLGRGELKSTVIMRRKPTDKQAANIIANARRKKEKGELAESSGQCPEVRVLDSVQTSSLDGIQTSSLDSVESNNHLEEQVEEQEASAGAAAYDVDSQTSTYTSDGTTPFITEGSDSGGKALNTEDKGSLDSVQNSKVDHKARTKKMTESIIAEKRERSATPAVYSMGTPDGDIDYAELAAQDKTIKFYYDKHMNIEGMKPKAAYKLACKKAGKEVKA